MITKIKFTCLGVEAFEGFVSMSSTRSTSATRSGASVVSALGCLLSYFVCPFVSPCPLPCSVIISMTMAKGRARKKAVEEGEEELSLLTSWIFLSCDCVQPKDKEKV